MIRSARARVEPTTGAQHGSCLSATGTVGRLVVRGAPPWGQWPNRTPALRRQGPGGPAGCLRACLESAMAHLHLRVFLMGW